MEHGKVPFDLLAEGKVNFLQRRYKRSGNNEEKREH